MTLDGMRKKALPLMLQQVAPVAWHHTRLRQLRSHRCEPCSLQSYRLPRLLMKPAAAQAAEQAIWPPAPSAAQEPEAQPRPLVLRWLRHAAV